MDPFKHKQYVIVASSISLLKDCKIYPNIGELHAESNMIQNNLRNIINFRTNDTIYKIYFLITKKILLRSLDGLVNICYREAKTFQDLYNNNLFA